ncbi:UMP-CMP kinase 3 [Striga hermonthica]|uniref:UMP-CMP kinase 3 n=1 Tax=Striga hermonthica TaxID=68872 RepID=A0A9N7N0C2_STRHE|nr:UMP-CMP kinase 3 [Striga hermonthica]
MAGDRLYLFTHEANLPVDYMFFRKLSRQITAPGQTGIVSEFILFFDCPEEEMERHLLSRNHINAANPVEEVFEAVQAVFGRVIQFK